MVRSVYITTTEAYSGKSLISLGLTSQLLLQTSRVGVFRPVIEGTADDGRDKNIDLLLSHFSLGIDYEDTFAFYRDEVSSKLIAGEQTEILNTIFEKYKALESLCDFVVCIGSDFASEGHALEFDFNAEVARNLGAPVIIVSGGVGRSVNTIAGVIHAMRDAYVERGCEVIGAVANRVDPEIASELLQRLRNDMTGDGMLLSVIPAHKALSSPTMGEVADFLEADILYGGDQLDRLAYHNLVIAMQIPNYLPYLTENSLLITSGDRSDVLVSALQAHQSRNYPQIAGIVLTGGLHPPSTVARLLDGMRPMIPILSTTRDTFETAAKVREVRSYITAESTAKIRLSLRLFEQHMDLDALHGRMSNVLARGMTPRMFLYTLREQARSNKQHIVLPEGIDERILQAAARLRHRDVVDLTLIGEPSEVQALIYRLGLEENLQDVPIIFPPKSPLFPPYVDTLVELRQHKGMNRDMAADLMCDVSYFGTMMVYRGDADGMVSGAIHTTGHTIRPALQFVKTKPGISVVSSVFFMCLEDRVLVYGDCAVNPTPTAEQLAEIAIASADSAITFGIEPLVAMLSYSSGASGEGEEVDKVRRATQLARQLRPDLLIEGPLQYDAAVAADVAAIKMPGSKVAGKATVLIFPDLNTGNNTYKAVQRETGAIAIGPILQGLRKPVNDLSRGCTVEDVINTVIITAIQAQETCDIRLETPALALG